jgi:hypothetical protein
LRRAFAALTAACLVALLAPRVSAQVNPPAPAPAGPVNPALAPAAGATPAPSPSAGAAGSPGLGEASPVPGETLPPPAPTPSPTPPPIVVTPGSPSIEPGRTIVVRVESAAGTITATAADPALVGLAVDQLQRTIAITGLAVGSTLVTVGDDRGLTTGVPVRVALDAGTVPDRVVLRVTGDPASAGFLRDAVIRAVTAAATLQPGAAVAIASDGVPIRGDLPVDDKTALDVPVQIAGDAYIAVRGTTRVILVNDALPRLTPSRLLVSDYPERLTADGVLFTATIDSTRSQRFLYYHYNPSTEPARRILVKVTNASAAPAIVHLLAGLAGPGSNEMEVGHTATKTFLVRLRRNEGTVVTIPPGSTVNLVNHDLPPNAIVSGILQLREIRGDPLDIAVVAQRADAPLDQSADVANLLAGGAPHARGVYPVPEFFSEYTYVIGAPAPLEIPIGQLPLPNLRVGEALAGDYGVLQALRVVIVNNSRFGQAIALYANPRGGDATGTFIIDNTLVQAHRLTAFSRYKIWQETIAPGTYRTLQVTTMPEGGSSYPLRLVFAPDDGSVAPGAPGSPVY